MSIGIVTVNYNDRAGLIRTQTSIRSQYQRPAQWLIIDGASTDDSLKVLDGEQEVISEPDSGIYSAMNKGLGLIDTEFVWFLNSGDELASPHVVGLVRETLRAEPGATLIYGDALERNKDGIIQLKRARNPDRIELGLFTHHQAIIYRTMLVAAHGFDARLTLAADYELTWRVLQSGGPLLRIGEPLCVFELGGTSHKERGRGRLEQLTVRRRMGVPLLRNIGITTVQIVAAGTRQYLRPIHRYFREWYATRSFREA